MNLFLSNNLFITQINKILIILTTFLMNTVTYLIYFFITHIYPVFLLSIFIHAFILTAILSGFLGNKIRESTILWLKFLDRNYYLPQFLIVFLILCYFNYAVSPIFADTSGTITIRDSNITFSADIYDLLNKVGIPAMVFTTSGKIIATLVQGSKLGIYPKIGTTLTGAAGFTLSFKMVQIVGDIMQESASKAVSTSAAVKNAIITVEDVKVMPNPIASISGSPNFPHMSSASQNALPSPSLSHSWTESLQGPMFNNHFYGSTFNQVENIPLNQGTGVGTANAIFNQVPSDIWYLNVVNAPFEAMNPAIISLLSHTLLLSFIITYLIFMLFIFFTSKILLANNVDLSKLPLGYYINKIVGNILLFTQKSANVWIYLILISLLFFSMIMNYVLYFIVNNL